MLHLVGQLLLYIPSRVSKKIPLKRGWKVVLLFGGFTI